MTNEQIIGYQIAKALYHLDQLRQLQQDLDSTMQISDAAFSNLFWHHVASWEIYANLFPENIFYIGSGDRVTNIN